jgi:hypothetical protein
MTTENSAELSLFDRYQAPLEVYEGRNWITGRLIMARGFHALDMIEDTCSFEDKETPDNLRRRLREVYEMSTKTEVIIKEAFRQALPQLLNETGPDSAHENIRSCIQEIRDRGSLTGRENTINLQLRLQWVLSLVSHVKYHLAGIDQ